MTFFQKLFAVIGISLGLVSGNISTALWYNTLFDKNVRIRNVLISIGISLLIILLAVIYTLKILYLHVIMYLYFMYLLSTRNNFGTIANLLTGLIDASVAYFFITFVVDSILMPGDYFLILASLILAVLLVLYFALFKFAYYTIKEFLVVMLITLPLALLLTHVMTQVQQYALITGYPVHHDIFLNPLRLDGTVSLVMILTYFICFAFYLISTRRFDIDFIVGVAGLAIACFLYVNDMSESALVSCLGGSYFMFRFAENSSFKYKLVLLPFGLHAFLDQGSWEYIVAIIFLFGIMYHAIMRFVKEEDELYIHLFDAHVTFYKEYFLVILLLGVLIFGFSGFNPFAFEIFGEVFGFAYLFSVAFQKDNNLA